MTEIIEYRLVFELFAESGKKECLEKFSGKVNSLIRQGYQPFGGVSAFTQHLSSGRNKAYALQAMVKYAEGNQKEN